MKIAVRYQSRGGNTKAVAEAIANAANVKAEPIDVPFNEPIDILFIGGGVYAQDIDRSLKNYLETLDPNDVKSIAAFSTSGLLNCTRKITIIVKAKQIHTFDETLPVKFGVRNHAWLGGKGHVTLSDKQLRLVEDFVKKTLTKNQAGS